MSSFLGLLSFPVLDVHTIMACPAAAQVHKFALRLPMSPQLSGLIFLPQLYFLGTGGKFSLFKYSDNSKVLGSLIRGNLPNLTFVKSILVFFFFILMNRLKYNLVYYLYKR